MMRKITILCNPKATPVKFPCDIKFMYTEEGASMGEVRIARAMKKWEELHKDTVILRYEVEEQVGPILEGMEGETLKGG